MDIIRKSAIRGIKATDIATFLKNYKGKALPSLQ